MNSMRLCFVIYTLEAGGAERAISQLASYFADKDGYDVHLVTLQEKGAKSFYPLSQNLQLHQIGLESKSGTLAKVVRLSFFLFALRRKIKDLEPDKVVSFIDQMNILTLLASLGLRQEVIISERIDPRHHNIGAVSNLLRRILYPLASSLVVQGGYIASYFSYMGRKCAVIPNPVPQVKSPQPSLKSTKIIAVGRLNFQKDHKTLIKAFASLVPNYPEWTLEIYGEGPERESLEALIKERSLGDNVFLKGITTSIQDVLNESSVFAFPSLFEGFPNALGEAMARGIPVVVSDCGGNLELVTHGENGLVFPIGDENKLAHHLEVLMADPKKRGDLGKKAEASLEAFAPTLVYKKWEDVFKS